MVGNSPTMGGFPTTGWKPNHWLESQPRCGWNSDHLLNQYLLIETLYRKYFSALNISSDKGRFLEGPSPYHKYQNKKISESYQKYCMAPQMGVNRSGFLPEWDTKCFLRSEQNIGSYPLFVEKWNWWNCDKNATKFRQIKGSFRLMAWTPMPVAVKTQNM